MLKEFFENSSITGYRASPAEAARSVVSMAERTSKEEQQDFFRGPSGAPAGHSILEGADFDRSLKIPVQYFKRMGFLPIYRKNGELIIALGDPRNFRPVNELLRQMGFRACRWVLSPLEGIRSAVELLFEQNNGAPESAVQDTEASEAAEDIEDLQVLRDFQDAAHEAWIIRMLNMILTQAIGRRASDIHIEPNRRTVKVRFRIDGTLHEVFFLPKNLQPQLISRVKAMADLNTAERRLPQDGRLRIKSGNETVDIQVSVIPTASGERMVLKLPDKNNSPPTLEDLGMPAGSLAVYEKLIQRSSGIILVTGPAGSGKTTTLYASIGKINSVEKNIITIEEPIEYELQNVGQIQVNPNNGLDFAGSLRSVLRHDPDIIMVGEMRDLETAEIAARASLTGDLVFSTLQAHDAAGALIHLVDMGVKPPLIASSLLAVLAQRLVRRVCVECRDAFEPDSATLVRLGLDRDQVFFRGKGCPACTMSGYKGRTGIFELLEMENRIRELLVSGADAVAIREAARKQRMQTLFEHGLEKVSSGVTTLDELMQVEQE